MKALTICQPYAELIVSGEKLIENRKWPTRYRGELLVHAGKSKDWLREEDDPKAFVYGAIVGVVTVVQCCEYRHLYGTLFDPSDKLGQGYMPRPQLERQIEDWAWGPYCWILHNPRRIEPIPYVGAMGLFDVPDQLLAASRADQLTEIDKDRIQEVRRS